MKKRKSTKDSKVHVNKQKVSLTAKFTQRSFMVKAMVILLIITAVGGGATYAYSRMKANEYAAFASTALPDKWAVLKDGIGYKWYTCQIIKPENNVPYAVGIVVKTPDAPRMSISVKTYSDSNMEKETGSSDNNGVYWMDEISAPAAPMRSNGWAKVTINGEEFAVARGFMPPCDDHTEGKIGGGK